jgi:hypothetical protein
MWLLVRKNAEEAQLLVEGGELLKEKGLLE